MHVPAVQARALLAVVSASYHGDGCMRFDIDPWGYVVDCGHVCQGKLGNEARTPTACQPSGLTHQLNLKTEGGGGQV